MGTVNETVSSGGELMHGGFLISPDEPFPAAVLSHLAHVSGRDLVVVLDASHGQPAFRYAVYGRTERDKALAKRLAKAIARVLAGEVKRGNAT